MIGRLPPVPLVEVDELLDELVEPPPWEPELLDVLPPVPVPDEVKPVVVMVVVPLVVLKVDVVVPPPPAPMLDALAPHPSAAIASKQEGRRRMMTSFR
jgi:hypothetical protein